MITAEMFKVSLERYEIRKGTLQDAPPCPFGNKFKWTGFDKNEMEYVRVTKSVFKQLVEDLDKDFVEKYESDFDDLKDNQ